MARVRQYTVRGIPDELDRRLREEARAAQTSVNRVVVDTLRAAKLAGDGQMHTDLDWFIGGGSPPDTTDDRAAAKSWLDAAPRDLA